ncbi:hypothetical protein Syun_001666 [Stephania yunnanensis]|uniref:Uncharacterized protein n=1 Tax=Stephania yunnanensis TaxID=152371 RepID=A0AAP0QB49_9MAGN
MRCLSGLICVPLSPRRKGERGRELLFEEDFPYDYHHHYYHDDHHRNYNIYCV